MTLTAKSSSYLDEILFTRSPSPYQFSPKPSGSRGGIITPCGKSDISATLSNCPFENIHSSMRYHPPRFTPVSVAEASAGKMRRPVSFIGNAQQIRNLPFSAQSRQGGAVAQFTMSSYTEEEDDDVSEALSPTGSSRGFSFNDDSEVVDDFLLSTSLLGESEELCSPEAAKLVSRAIDTRREAWSHLGSLNGGATPTEESLALFHETLSLANDKLKMALSSIDKTEYPAFHTHVTFQIYYNFSLSLNSPSHSPPSSEIGTLPDLMASIKAYDFVSCFQVAKGCDHIDYFLSGCWTPLAVLRLSSFDALRKYRSRFVVAFSQTAVKSGDYASCWLECLTVVLCPVQTMICCGEVGLAASILKSICFEDWENETFMETYDILEANSVKFLNLFTRNYLSLTCKLLLLLCGMAPEFAKSNQDWIPSDADVLAMEEASLLAPAVLGLPCLVCLVYEKLGRAAAAISLADAALKAGTGGTGPQGAARVHLCFVLGRCLAKDGALGEARERFEEAKRAAEVVGMKLLVESAEKQKNRI
mmetsp:Transcript_5953/g.11278  ORF Transcript_5953/g.11278 Transcript_5953/m.11278 type:complete len:532 (+) Transcript_5953:1094-2689(+)